MKKLEKGNEIDDDVYTCMSNYYLWGFFIEIIDDKK
jgi:hypothetical protein